VAAWSASVVSARTQVLIEPGQALSGLQWRLGDITVIRASLPEALLSLLATAPPNYPTELQHPLIVHLKAISRAWRAAKNSI